MRIPFTLLIIAAGGIALLGQTAQGPPTAVSVRKVMTEAEFRGAGLTKLTDAELKALDAWLTAFALKLLNFSRSATETSAEPSSSARATWWRQQSTTKRS